MSTARGAAPTAGPELSSGWSFHSLTRHVDGNKVAGDDESERAHAASSTPLSELVQEFHDDGFLCLASVLTPHFIAGLREECMTIFGGVLGWLHEAGEAEFRESYRRSPIAVSDAPLSGAPSTAKYNYPLGVGLKNGYRELVMRSPGRYELALLIDDLPRHFEGVHANQADYDGKWLLNANMFDRARGTAMKKQFSAETDERPCNQSDAGRLKQLLQWIQHKSSGNGSNNDSHNQQYPTDRKNVERFKELVDAIYTPPSNQGDGNCDNNALKDEYYLCNLSLLVATPGCPTQSWHADGGHVSLTQHQRCHVFNVFIPLMDVPLSLGPTELRPGTHYHTRNLAPMMLAARARKTLRAPVTPEMKAGDALAFDYRILHRGRANMSDKSDPEGALDARAGEQCTTSDEETDGNRGKDRPVLVMTFARSWFSDVVNFPKRSIFAA